MKYYSIVFMDGSEAEEPLRLVNDDPSKAFEYLKEWDYGPESEHCMSEYDSEPWGNDDYQETFEDNNGVYCLAWNNNLDYISLTRMVKQ